MPRLEDVARTAPTTVDLAWLAGFLEGEGSFGFTQSSACVSAKQVQRWPLEVCLRIVGGRINSSPKPTPTSQPFFTWAVGGRIAAGLMMTLYPLLSPRRKQQIDAVLVRWRSRPAGTKYQKFCKRGHLFSPENVYHSKRQRACKLCHHVAQARYRKERRLLRASA